MFNSTEHEISTAHKNYSQCSTIALVRSYLPVPRAAGQVKILIFLVKIKFSPLMPIIFVLQGKCLFSDISRPDNTEKDRYFLLLSSHMMYLSC